MALIPPWFMDCVVTIGVDDNGGDRQWIASGFLYGQYKEKNEKGKKLYQVYLVSNRHVLEEPSHVYIRFNPQKNSDPAREYKVKFSDDTGRNLLFNHPDPQVDITVVPIRFDLLREHAMQAMYFRSDEHVANRSKLIELEVMEGDFVYALGFPMGMVGEKRSAVIVRNGVIARLRDLLAETDASSDYLVDVFVYPGNSGGPVILKPEFARIDGTKSNPNAILIGVITESLTYQDTAISLQTKRPRITFEENSGLAVVHPIDYVDDAIQEHLKLLK